MSTAGVRLALLAATLISIIGFDVVPHRVASPPPPAGYSLIVAKPPIPAAVDATAALVDTVLARPLFQADRRPAEADPGKAVPAAGRLTGIVVSQGVGRLIFAGAAGGKPIIAAEGDRIGADIVQAIGAGQATLLGPEGATTISPSFSDQDGGTARDPRPATAQPAESRLSRHQPVH